MRKTPAKFLSVFCAALLAVNAAALGTAADNTEDIATAVPESSIIFDSPDDAVLYWATQVGWDMTGWSDCPSGFTVAENGYIYICAADNIYKLDKNTGELVNGQPMLGSVSYATKGPAYVDGKVFMALDNGTIQAFDADTLKPLWIYHNKLGGTPTCDIVYNEGKIYTGFWNGEEEDADYVCIDITTDDETSTTEEKTADLEITNKGGYYWTTAAFTEDYIFIGRDNGTSEVTSAEDAECGIFMVDRKTGEYVTEGGIFGGDIRSKLVSFGDSLFFTTKDGALCSYTYSKDGAASYAYNLTEALGLGGYTCTSTPIIANDRIYVTLNAPGWDLYNGSMIAVFDYVDGEFPFEFAYAVETSAACQADGIFAGVDEEGYNVLYYVENGYTGVIRKLRDKKGMKEPLELVEEYDADNMVHSCLPAIFKPQGEHAQCCAVDPVYDPATGLIYVRYDSFNILAIGTAMDNIYFKADDITIHPDGVDTLVYKVDQTPTDCECVIGFEGGFQGNITDTFENTFFSVDKFTTDDEVLTVTHYYGLYNGNAGTSSVSADINVLVAEDDDQYTRALAQRGDVNGDGVINVTDISLIAAHVKSKRAFDKFSLNAADVNAADGINVTDISVTAAQVKGISPIDTAR